MDDARTVFCGNLSDKVTEELLFELFLQAAPIERVKIPTDKEGKKSNFGFITFKHEQSVNYVLQLLNGIRLYDKNIQVKPRFNNSANRLPEKNSDTSNVLSRLGFQNRPQENRESHGSRGNFRDHYRDESHRGFRDNYNDNHRDNSYNRHDDRERHDSSNRRRQNYGDRRGGHRNRNRYY